MCDLRLFLAIDVPNPARDKITEVQSDLKTLNLDAVWVKPANMHLTVKFLGNTAPDLIPEIQDRLETIVHSTPPFFLTLGSLGVFPNLSRPRVLWVGVQETDSRLGTLKKEVEREMTALGFPGDTKKSIHHMTLGRLKSNKGKERVKEAVASGKPLTVKPFQVGSVRLIKSGLTPKGPIYTVLQEFFFTGSSARH